MAPPEPMVGRAPEGPAVGAASMGHVKKSDGSNYQYWGCTGDVMGYSIKWDMNDR